MARYTGKNLAVKVDDSGASLTTLTHVTAASITYEYEEVEMRGDTERAALAGQQISRVEVEYEHDDTALTGNHVILGGIVGNNTTPRTLEVYPYGTTAGNPKFAMESVLLSFGPTGINREGKLVGTAIFAHHANATDTPAWGTAS
jgi:hypothetical protein